MYAGAWIFVGSSTRWHLWMSGWTAGGRWKPAWTKKWRAWTKLLFGEVARSAEDIWKRVYAGKSEVTHKALSPLKTLHAKLAGLSFVEPHVAPVADIIMSALDRMPKRGVISGADLLLLQGLVCLLKDSQALITQAQGLIDGACAGSVLDDPMASELPQPAENESPGEEGTEVSPTEPEQAPELVAPLPRTEIPSMGLW